MKTVLHVVLPALLIFLLLSACAPAVQNAEATQPIPPRTTESGAQTPHPTPNTSATVPPAACSDAAAFVADVSIPDGFQVAPGVAFTMIWRLKNVGSCSWDQTYLVSYVSGTTMTQQPAYFIMGGKERVEPGQTVDISVGMSAPVQNGTYSSYWGIKGPNGQLVPVDGGANGNAFYVQIKVVDASVLAGKVIGQSVKIETSANSSPACSANAAYVVTADITADGPVSADYELSSDSGLGPVGNFVGAAINEQYPVMKGTIEFQAELFAQGGTRTLSLPFLFVGPYPHPEDITIYLSLNGGGRASAKLVCP